VQLQAIAGSAVKLVRETHNSAPTSIREEELSPNFCLFL
jgi:hypothetical protein